MDLTPCSRRRKANWLTIYENQYFIARNSTAETLLLGDSIKKDLNRYKGTSYKYFPNSFNFSIREDRTKNFLWRALNLPDISYLTNVIILCGTNNSCIDSTYDIAQCLIDIDVCFQKRSPKVKRFISRILPKDECYSVNRILTKEINTTLKFKSTFHRFDFIEQEQRWIDNNDTLDPSLFYHFFSTWFKKKIEAIRINYNSYRRCKYWSEYPFQRNNLSFKLNQSDFPPQLNSAVSKPVSFVSSLLSSTTASRFFSKKVSAISFKSLTKVSKKPFPRATRFCPGNFAPKHLHNPSQPLILDLAHNIPTKLKHYICKFVMLFEPIVFLFVLWLFIMLSLSIQYIIFVECFHLCIVLQVSISTFLIRDMKMLQALLCYHQIYFLLLVLNLIFQLRLQNLIFHHNLRFLLEPQLLRTLNMCLHQLKFSCFLWLCSKRSY